MKGKDGVGSRYGRQRVQEAKGEGRVEGVNDEEKGWDGKMREGKEEKERVGEDGRYAAIGCKLKQNANEGCNSCASLAGLVLCFVAAACCSCNNFKF